MANPAKTQPVTTPALSISVPDGFFQNLRAEYEAAAKVAADLKAKHDSAFDLLASFAPGDIPAGVERIEKRGRKAKDETSSEETTNA